MSSYPAQVQGALSSTRDHSSAIKLCSANYDQSDHYRQIHANLFLLNGRKVFWAGVLFLEEVGAERLPLSPRLSEKLTVNGPQSK